MSTSANKHHVACVRACMHSAVVRTRIIPPFAFNDMIDLGVSEVSLSLFVLFSLLTVHQV